MQAYKQVIAILASGNFNANEIAIRLAQENPSLFLKFTQPKIKVENNATRILNSLRSNTTLVPAVKLYRDLTNCGLAEGLDYVKGVVHAAKMNGEKFIQEFDDQGLNRSGMRELAIKEYNEQK